MVVDREFGNRLTDFSEPVWVVDTTHNRPAIECAWSTLEDKGPAPEVTSYQPRPDGDIAEEIRQLLPTIEEHHGEYSHDPPMDAVRIYGFAYPDRIANAFADFDFKLSEHGDRVCEFRR